MCKKVYRPPHQLSRFFIASEEVGVSLDHPKLRQKFPTLTVLHLLMVTER